MVRKKVNLCPSYDENWGCAVSPIKRCEGCPDANFQYIETESIKEYYIGSGDYYGENSPNVKFNKEIVPRLISLGIKKEDMDEVAEMFVGIYEIGFSNGADNERARD